MANIKVTGRTETTTPVITDVIPIVVAPGSTPVDRKVALGNLYKGLGTGTPSASTFLAGDGSWKSQVTKIIAGSVSNPQAVYAQRAQIVMFRAPFDLTITRIHIECAVTSQELAGDLKWATDTVTGSYADAAVIDVCDTTSGVFTITSGMDDATVAAGKYIYFQMDASPHDDITDFYIEFYYTVD